MRITDLREQQEMPADTILKEIGVSKAEREYIVEFLPLIPLALWGAGAAWTAYDTYKSKKQMDNGEITAAEFKKRVGRDVAITLLAGPTLKLVGGIGKLGWKGGKKVISMIGGGAAKAGDEVADVSAALANKIDNGAGLYTSGSAKLGTQATRAAVSNIDNVAIAARQAADKGATIAKNSSQAVTDIATAKAAKQATKVAVGKIDNVAIAAKQAADRGATVAKNSSQAVTDIATAKAAKTATAIATKKASQLAAKNAASAAASDSKLIGLAGKVATRKAADLATKKAAQIAARRAAKNTASAAASDSKLIGLAAKVTAKNTAKKLAARNAASTVASDKRLLGLAGRATAKKIAAKKLATTVASDKRLLGLAARTGARKIDNVIAKKVGKKVTKDLTKKGGKRGAKWLRRMRGALRGGGDSGAGYDSNLQGVVKKYGY